MIVDAHTHVFPREFIAGRDALVHKEPIFADLFTSRDARMATADDLLHAIDAAGVDRAVIAGFAWSDPDNARRHNDVLLDAAARANGRVAAVCCVTPGPAAVREMERCAAAGARGFGELRIDADTRVGWDGRNWEEIADAASDLGLPLLLHASEPVGHRYPGKGGGSLGALWELLAPRDSLVAVLAHLGGGLPFYAHMPEVRALFTRTHIDTAAVPWLFGPEVYRSVIERIGAGHVLFGSDFPLRHPARDLRLLRGAGLDPGDLAAILGGNALRLFWPEED